jgi:hypothetical protein
MILTRRRGDRLAQKSVAGAPAIVSTYRSTDALPETVPLSGWASVTEQPPGHCVPACRGRRGSFSRFHIVAIRRNRNGPGDGASDRAIAKAARKNPPLSCAGS